MALMLKVCEMRERNVGGGARYRYIAGRIDEQTRIVLMPNREKPDSGQWILYIAPDATPPAASAGGEAPEG